MRETLVPRRIPLAVPGPWQTPEEFHRAALEQDKNFRLHENVLHYGTGQLCVAAFHEPDSGIALNFRACASGRFPPEVLDRVDRHASVAMGLGMELSPVVVRDMQLMAAALLRAGGFAVHVGSSGVVHTAEKWWQLSESNLTFDIYRSFVRLAVEPKYYYTCGMHNFGLPDSRIPRSGKPELAGEILNNFNLWRINQNPDLNAGETFSVNGVPGAFRLGKDFVGAFKPGEPFFNPFGIWTLEPVTQH